MTPALYAALSLVETSLNSVVCYYFHNHCTISQQAVLISGNQFSGIMWGGFCTLVLFTDLHQPLGYQVLTYCIVYISHVTVCYGHTCMCVCYHQASTMDVN